MAETSTIKGLRQAIQRSGYYPELVAEAIELAAGSESITSYVVHQETTFDEDQVRRHVTVLALTPTRLIAGHTDEHGADSTSPTPYATTSIETVPLHRVGSVVVSRTVADPATYVAGSLPSEVVLTLGWGVVGRLDLEPATCADPNCEADHGYTGSIAADDLSLRVSQDADGAAAVDQMLAFGAAVSLASASAAR